MKNKFRYLRITLLIVAVVAAVFANDGLRFNLNKTAYAVGDLSVDWGVPSGNPIFVVSNLAPGQSEERNVTVTNNAAVIRPVGVKGIKTSETGALASGLNIVISKNLVEVYGGTSYTGARTLQQFFTDSTSINGIFLGNQNPTEVASYKFKATFGQGSGNSFQNKTVIFDLQIGISIEIPEECQSIDFNGQTIFGTSGNNNLNGGSKNDLIIGFEGNDRINGGGGDDCLIGNEGVDRIKGGSGKDVLFGGTGDDDLDGGSERDQIFGNDGNDEIDGGSGNDDIFGGANNDEIKAGSGNDLVDAGAGDDEISGGSGDDNLNGGLGNNKIKGESGIDTCINALVKKTCELS